MSFPVDKARTAVLLTLLVLGTANAQHRNAQEGPATEKPTEAKNVDDVEEVVVVGSRIRRWLPIVGAAWPDRNCRLSVETVGAGSLRAVFVAGLGWSGSAWRDVARLAGPADGQRVLVTLPGSAGRRPCSWRGAVLERATELVASLLAKADAPVALIGNEFGARVALNVAVASDTVHNLVLFDFVPYQWPLQPGWIKTYRRTHTPATFAAQARIAPPGYWAATSRLGTGTEFTDKDALAEVRRTVRRTDPVTASYEYFLAIGPKADLRPMFASFGKPVLAVWPTGPAEKTRRETPDVDAQYAELDNVTWQPVTGYGAGAFFEAPEKIAAAGGHFLAGLGFPVTPLSVVARTTATQPRPAAAASTISPPSNSDDESCSCDWSNALPVGASSWRIRRHACNGGATARTVTVSNEAGA